MNITEYTCELCDYVFKGKQGLKGFSNHVLRQHPTITWTEYSNKFFKIEIDKTNIHQCQICGFIATGTKQGLGYHVTHIHHITTQQYYDLYLIKNTDKHCTGLFNEVCERTTDFISLRDGYKTHCKKCLDNSKHPPQIGYWNRVKNIKLKQQATIERDNWLDDHNKSRLNYWIKNGYADPYEHLMKYKIEKKLMIVNNYNGNNYSNVSQELFDELSKQLNIKDRCYYATNRKEWSFFLNKQYTNKLKQKMIHLDFYIPDHKLNIEFDGTYWHSLTKDKDQLKEQFLTDVHRVKTLRIKEFEYYNDKHACIQKCITFIKDNI